MFRVIISLLAMGLLAYQPTHAQTPAACPMSVEDALASLDAMCGELGQNQACYAADQVTAAFYGEVDEATFSEPSDRVELTALRTLATSPLDPETNTWGMALMRVQAMLPNTLPGQGVVFVMLGDVSVENSVSPDEAVVLDDPIEATVTVGAANLRSGPSTNFNVVGSATNGAVLGVDARNAAGDWLRVIYEETPAWVFADLVRYPEDINALPVITETTFSPMQAFIMKTGIGNAGCEEAPNSLLVQTPRNTNIELNVNGANVVIGSTVVFDTPTDSSVRLTVLDGEARIEDVTRVPAGFTAQIPVGDDAVFEPAEDTYNFDVAPIEEDVLDDYELFETLSDDAWLNYDFDLPEEVDDFAVFDDFEPEEFDGDFQGEAEDSSGFDVEEFSEEGDDFDDDDFGDDDFGDDDFDDSDDFSDDDSDNGDSDDGDGEED